jgi:hypothetical protein
MRLGEQGVGVVRVDTNHQSALTARRDRHVAADEERQATEHLLLSHVGLAAEQVADAACKLFVERHTYRAPASFVNAPASDLSMALRRGLQTRSEAAVALTWDLGTAFALRINRFIFARLM